MAAELAGEPSTPTSIGSRCAIAWSSRALGTPRSARPGSRCRGRGHTVSGPCPGPPRIPTVADFRPSPSTGHPGEHPEVNNFVRDFADGDMSQADLLGGKGANRAEMTRMGLPVPPGFTITTEACRVHLRVGEPPPA